MVDLVRLRGSVRSHAAGMCGGTGHCEVSRVHEYRVSARGVVNEYIPVEPLCHRLVNNI